MIATIRGLSIASTIACVFTLICLAGAYSAIKEQPMPRYVAPTDCPFAATAKGHTIHAIDCPLLPKQSARETNLIYFHSLKEATTAGKTDACPICGQRIKNADAKSITATPTTTPTPKPVAAASQD